MSAGSVDRQYTEFMALAETQAKFIADGGLKEEEEYSQINERAWKGLEEINRMGFITNDSQAGDIESERAYIIGFMFARDVQQFVENINLWSDKVAFFTLVDYDEGKIYSRIAVTRDYRPSRGWFGVTSLATGYPRSVAEIERRVIGIPDHMQAVHVMVFDPKWHRPTWSKNGLLQAVIRALENAPHPPPAPRRM